MADKKYLDALLVERAGKAGHPDAVAAIDAEIKRVGGTPPVDRPAPKPSRPTVGR